MRRTRNGDEEEAEFDFMQSISVHLCLISCIEHLSFAVFNLLLSVNHVACLATARICHVTAL